MPPFYMLSICFVSLLIASIVTPNSSPSKSSKDKNQQAEAVPANRMSNVEQPSYGMLNSTAPVTASPVRRASSPSVTTTLSPICGSLQSRRAVSASGIGDSTLSTSMYSVPKSPPLPLNEEEEDEDNRFSQVQQFAEAQLAAMLNDLEALKAPKSRSISRTSGLDNPLTITSSAAPDVVDHSTPLGSPREYSPVDGPRTTSTGGDTDLVLADLSGLALGGTLRRPSDNTVAGSFDDEAEWSQVSFGD